NTIRVRLATLSSFGKWAVRRDKLVRNPIDALTRPRKKARLPHVPRWETIERLLQPSNSPRERALVALMALGGLRRSECVTLDVGDVVPDFGLRRVLGKGGHEASMPLPAPARAILVEYLRTARAGAAPTEPLFVVTFPTKGGKRSSRRMSGQRVWEIVKDLGRRVGVPELHPHALRHACGAELLRRTHGNLRVVQEHLRHRRADHDGVHEDHAGGSAAAAPSLRQRGGVEKGFASLPRGDLNSGAKNSTKSPWWPHGDLYGSGPASRLHARGYCLPELGSPLTPGSAGGILRVCRP